MLEPRVTPVASATPTYYLDQIDVAVELPMGPPGPQGVDGTEWIVGPGDVPPTGTWPDGTLFLGSDGKIHRYDEATDTWLYTNIDLLPDAGAGGVPLHEHDQYLDKTGDAMTGPLSVLTPVAPEDAVNLDYLTNEITNLNLAKFLGDIAGNAISTLPTGWVSALGQAIYQNPNPIDVPPGVTGSTLGLTMRHSSGNISQMICEVSCNIWYTRTQVGNVFGAWSTLTPIISTAAPVDAPNAAPNGTIWIQTDSTVAP